MKLFTKSPEHKIISLLDCKFFFLNHFLFLSLTFLRIIPVPSNGVIIASHLITYLQRHSGVRGLDD